MADIEPTITFIPALPHQFQGPANIEQRHAEYVRQSIKRHMIINAGVTTITIVICVMILVFLSVSKCQ